MRIALTYLGLAIFGTALALWCVYGVLNEVVTVRPEAPSLQQVWPIPDLLQKVSQEEVDVDYLAFPDCDSGELARLACGIYFEARNQSVAGQYLVAIVILNRVADTRWPNSIEAVVRQGEKIKNGCQFSFMCDGKPEQISEMAAWILALKVAKMAMRDYQNGERATCAHSYHADTMTSISALLWFAKFRIDRKEGAHIFYCDEIEGKEETQDS